MVCRRGVAGGSGRSAAHLGAGCRWHHAKAGAACELASGGVIIGGYIHDLPRYQEQRARAAVSQAAGLQNSGLAHRAPLPLCPAPARPSSKNLTSTISDVLALATGAHTPVPPTTAARRRCRVQGLVARAMRSAGRPVAHCRRTGCFGRAAAAHQWGSSQRRSKSWHPGGLPGRGAAPPTLEGARS